MQLTARIHQQTAGMKMASRFFFFLFTLLKCRFKWIGVRYEEEILRKKRSQTEGAVVLLKHSQITPMSEQEGNRALYTPQ